MKNVYPLKVGWKVRLVEHPFMSKETIARYKDVIGIVQRVSGQGFDADITVDWQGVKGLASCWGRRFVERIK